MSTPVAADRLKFAVRAYVPRELRNWLRSPTRSFQWLWDQTQSGVGRTRTLRFPYGCTLRCHPHAFRAAQKAQLAEGEQNREFRTFLSNCGRNMFLLDLGANFGIFSLAAARLGGKAIAVEPSPMATRIIAKQADLNGLTGRIRILQAAVSDQNGRIDMLSAGVFSDGYFRTVKGRSSHELTQTPSITVDRLATIFGVPTHIKIDVEGHEAAVLRGSRRTLDKFAPTLFLELHNRMVGDAGENPALTLDELSGLGYRIFSLYGQPLTPQEILQHPLLHVVAARPH